MSNARHRLGLTLTLIGVLAAGCSSQPPMTEVSGTLTMNGKPLGNIRVDFHPDPDQKTSGPGSSGKTDENGKFTLMCSNKKPGALIGFHRVILTDLDLFGNKFVGRGEYKSEDKAGNPIPVPKKPRFSEIYSDLARTPIKQEVKAGMGPVAIDIKK